uniref:Uncharacterized protein n=1 Tax=Arundo donax TaxID=35708 RepID=A0A0A9E477_ARUDO
MMAALPRSLSRAARLRQRGRSVSARDPREQRRAGCCWGGAVRSGR